MIEAVSRWYQLISQDYSTAKIILHESGRLAEIVKEAQGELSGELRIGIICTNICTLPVALVYEFIFKKIPNGQAQDQ